MSQRNNNKRNEAGHVSTSNQQRNLNSGRAAGLKLRREAGTFVSVVDPHAKIQKPKKKVIFAMPLSTSPYFSHLC